MSKFSFSQSTNSFVSKDYIPTINRATIIDGKLIDYYVKVPLSGRDDLVLSAINYTFDYLEPTYTYVENNSAKEFNNSYLTGFSAVKVNSNKILGASSADKTIAFSAIHPMAVSQNDELKVKLSYADGYYISYYQMAMLQHGYIDGKNSVAMSRAASATVSSWAFCDSSAANKSIAWYNSTAVDSAFAMYDSIAKGHTAEDADGNLREIGAIALWSSTAAGTNECVASDCVPIALYESDACNAYAQWQSTALNGGVAFYHSVAGPDPHSEQQNAFAQGLAAYNSVLTAGGLAMYNSTAYYGIAMHDSESRGHGIALWHSYANSTERSEHGPNYEGVNSIALYDSSAVQMSLAGYNSSARYQSVSMYNSSANVVSIAMYNSSATNVAYSLYYSRGNNVAVALYSSSAANSAIALFSSSAENSSISIYNSTASDTSIAVHDATASDNSIAVYGAKASNNYSVACYSATADNASFAAYGSTSTNSAFASDVSDAQNQSIASHASTAKDYSIARIGSYAEDKSIANYFSTAKKSSLAMYNSTAEDETISIWENRFTINSKGFINGLKIVNGESEKGNNILNIIE